MENDFEFNALRGIMNNKELVHIMERLYQYRWDGVTWEDRFAWGCDELMGLGLECFEHPTQSRTVVAFMHGTRRKRPPCLVIGVSVMNPRLPSAVDTYVGSGLIQLVPKGEINVADMAGESADATDRTEAEDTALLD